MNFQFVGIKCDRPGCNYRDDEVTVAQYKLYVNEPCPKCGENLMTTADYETVQKLLKLNDNLFLRAFEYVCSLFGIADINTEYEMDGSGKLKPQPRHQSKQTH